MQYYTHRKDLVSIKRIDEDGFVLTQIGEIPVFEGQYTLTDPYGNIKIVSEELINENYVLVNKVETKQSTPKKSPFELQMEEAYKQSWVGYEDTQYITGTYLLSKNKN